MKYTTLASMLGVTSAYSALFRRGTEDEKKFLIKEDLLGIRVFYDAYLQSLYNVHHSPSDFENCLDDFSVTNLENIGLLLTDPLILIEPKNWGSDIHTALELT